MPRKSDKLAKASQKQPETLAETHRMMLEEAGINLEVLKKAAARLQEALDARKTAQTRDGDVIELGPDWPVILAAVKEINLLLGTHAPTRVVGEGGGQTTGPVVVINVPDWLKPSTKAVEVIEVK